MSVISISQIVRAGMGAQSIFTAISCGHRAILFSSTKTWTTLQICARINSVRFWLAWLLISLTRSLDADLSTCSGITAAGVPGRGENGNAWILIGFASRTKFNVSLNSSSDSPGNPQIISQLKLILPFATLSLIFVLQLLLPRLNLRYPILRSLNHSWMF